MLLAVGVLACGEKIDRELSPGGFIGAEVVSPRIFRLGARISFN